MLIKVDQGQSRSIKVDQGRSRSIKVDQGRSRLDSVGQCRSVSVSVGQCRSVSVKYKKLTRGVSPGVVPAAEAGSAEAAAAAGWSGTSS